MGRIFAAIGMIVVFLAAAAAIGFYYLAQKGRSLDREAAAYSAEAVTAITSHWDAAALASRSTPLLGQSISPDKLAGMFRWFGTLGSLQDQPECRGTSSYYANNGSSAVTAYYVCAAHYKAGPAEVSVSLIKQGQVWRISGFHVTSPVLVPQKDGQPI
jgi:hypothetical protein